MYRPFPSVIRRSLIAGLLLFVSAMGSAQSVAETKRVIKPTKPATEMSQEKKTEPKVEKTAKNDRELLIKKVDEFFNDSRFESAFWGAKIESLKTGEVWYERNANKLFMPASNQKIPTTAAALSILGPDFKFPTNIQTNGEINDGVLAGDLVIHGTGDPTLYERFYDDSRDAFRSWAEKLKEKGVEKIDGRIIGDDDAWDDNTFNTGWPLSNLSAWYGAPYSSLQINEGYVDLKVTPPDTADGEVKIEGNLPSTYYTIDNRVEVVEEGRTSIWTNRDFGTNTLVVGGTAKVGGDSTERSPSIWNPTQFYVHVLKEVLEEEGIEVTGEAIDCDDLEGWDEMDKDFMTLFVHESVELKEILSGLMKRSQNMYAETMVRVVGWKKSGEGSMSSGREAIDELLRDLGVEGEYRFSDGSGLSRYNYVAPDQLIAILKGMLSGEHGEIWKETFPIAGVDGTLRRRMKGTPAENNVRAKTGTISNTRGLSGYVTTAAGEELVFSFLVNAHTTSTGATNDVTDGALALIAAYEGE